MPSSFRLDRRQILRFGAAALAQPAFTWGCRSDAEGGTDGPGGSGGGPGAPDSGAPFEMPTFAPDEPWWLQHNYASVDERELTELEVEGAIPPELDGLYVRNGSNAVSGESGHWFLGDGMLHGVRIQGGRALWYRNRFIQTEPYLQGGGYENAGPPSGGNNTSNVSVIHHAGRLLTSGEVGFPYEIDESDLSTRGVYDFGGALVGNFTAHPKIDAQTGEMFTFGYDFFPPYLRYHRVDAAGTLVHTEEIDLPASVMMHDFQITATRVVFMDLPILFDLDMVLEEGSAFPFRWNASNGSRIGVMPREGTNADLRWFEIENCFIFHTLNAYDHPTRPNVVVMVVARHPAGLWASGPDDFNSTPALYRYEIDLDAGRVTAEPLDDRLTEFVQLDRRLVGRENRYGYGVWLEESDGRRPGRFRGLLKWDLRDGGVSAHDLPAHLEAGEAYFVEASPDAGEDDGFLMSFVHDWRENRTDLYIFDATHLDADPIAKVKLPFRVPFGFHGMWVPA